MNQEIITQFVDEYGTINQLGHKRIYKYHLFLNKISQWLGKRFEDANKDDLIKVLKAIQESKLSENSKIDCIKILKTFAKYKGWDVSWIKARTPQTKVDASQLLDPDEIVKMVKAAKSARDRAIVMLLYEGAFRFSEFNNITIDSLSFKKDYVDVTIRVSKTYGFLYPFGIIYPIRKTKKHIINQFLEFMYFYFNPVFRFSHISINKEDI